MSDNFTRQLYIDLLKRCLTNTIYFRPTEEIGYDFRDEGKDWPDDAHTMIGLKRIDNIQFCVEKVLMDNIPGDLMETGVWKGGATIFMRGLLKAYGITNRSVWVADSFEGLPRPDLHNYPHDQGIDLYQFSELAVSLSEVQDNFDRYGLLDDQVKFVKGWFKDSLPQAPVQQLAVLRLDGDLYESTVNALDNLYPKLTPGGFLIVDDYGAVEACSQAVHDYRRRNGIEDEIIPVDWTGVFWQKTK
ncbi:TylF/MycF family methyltransferase [Desulfonatronovibrio magnus]|uniref:TylF/MycF family methyltransferase n=1 Tax=Desulfonatronovibrio magnus TaxID=698827 RepID=UPI0005EB07C1|nr:TylF/MycF family methyltransferase [Desulfonatronovibrio magnus]